MLGVWHRHRNAAWPKPIELRNFPRPRAAARRPCWDNGAMKRSPSRSVAVTGHSGACPLGGLARRFGRRTQGDRRSRVRRRRARGRAAAGRGLLRDAAGTARRGVACARCCLGERARTFAADSLTTSRHGGRSSRTSRAAIRPPTRSSIACLARSSARATSDTSRSCCARASRCSSRVPTSKPSDAWPAAPLPRPRRATIRTSRCRC